MISGVAPCTQISSCVHMVSEIVPQTPPNATILLWLFKIFRGWTPEPLQERRAFGASRTRPRSVRQKPHYYRHPSFYTNCLLTHHFNLATPLMMTSSNGNIFCVTGNSCREFTSPGEFPGQRPVTRSFDVFFDLCLNKQLSKQSWGRWFEMLSRLLWRHSNGSAKQKQLFISKISTYVIRLGSGYHISNTY